MNRNPIIQLILFASLSATAQEHPTDQMTPQPADHSSDINCGCTTDKDYSWHLGPFHIGPSDLHWPNGDKKMCTNMGLFHELYYVTGEGRAETVANVREFGMRKIISYALTFPKSRLAIGIGAGYQRIKFKHGLLPTINAGRLDFSPTITEDYAAMHTFSFQIPLTYTYFWSFLSFGAGVSANINAISHIDFHSSSGSPSRSFSLKNLHQRIITPEFSITIGFYRFVAGFAKYTPVSLFSSSRAPCISPYLQGGIVFLL